MRTTLTLDDDLARDLKRRAAESDRSFRQLVNDLLRAGLADEESSSARPYRVQPAAMGRPRDGVVLTHALQLADALEDAEIARELRTRR